MAVSQETIRNLNPGTRMKWSGRWGKAHIEAEVILARLGGVVGIAVVDIASIQSQGGDLDYKVGEKNIPVDISDLSLPVLVH